MKDHSALRTHPLLGEQIHHRCWPNGGQLWICPRLGNSVSLHLSVAAGSLDQGTRQDVVLPAGIAHFLEHRLFEKQDGDLSDLFAAQGADIDAETGYTQTSFTCSVSSVGVDTCLRLLWRLAFESYFPVAAIEREREIIQHEIELYEDNVEWVAFQAATRALYPNQPISVDIAGSRTSLESIDVAALEAAHGHLYRPDVTQLIVTGPVDAATICGLCDELFSQLPATLTPRPVRPMARPAPGRIRTALAVSRPRLLLGLAAAAPMGDPAEAMRRELHLEWILDILLGGSSRFFSEHYESSLIDGDSFGSEIYVDEPFSFCLIGGDTDDPPQLGERLLTTLSHSDTPDRIRRDADRARRRAYGELVTSFEDIDSVRDFIETATLRGCHPFDLVDLFLNTTADELIATWEGCLQNREAAWAIVDSGHGDS